MDNSDDTDDYTDKSDYNNAIQINDRKGVGASSYEY